MSVTFTASDWLDRAGATFDYNAAYTITAWVKMASAIAVSLVSVGPSSGTNDGEELDSLDSPVSFQCGPKYSGDYSGGAAGTTTYDNGQWWFVVLRRLDVDTIQLYVDDGVEATGADVTMSGRTAAGKIGLATWFDWAGGSPCTLAQVRFWNTNLSDGELATEKQWTTAQKSANLWAEYRLVNSGSMTTDSSGNGRTLTSHGSPSTGADDPTGQSSGGGGDLPLRTQTNMRQAAMRAAIW